LPLRRAIAGAIDFNYWFSGVLIPFLIFSLAALVHFTLGQLHTRAPRVHGALCRHNFELRCRHAMLLSFLLAGIVAALVGSFSGCRACRHTRVFISPARRLAAQFFVVWALTKFGWLFQLQAPPA